MKTGGKREAGETNKPHLVKVWTSQERIFGSNRPEGMATNDPTRGDSHYAQMFPPATTSGEGPPGESSHQAFTLSPLLMSEMPRNNWERFLREPNNGMHFHPGFIINVCIIYLSWRDYSD